MTCQDCARLEAAARKAVSLLRGTDSADINVVAAADWTIVETHVAVAELRAIAGIATARISELEASQKCLEAKVSFLKGDRTVEVNVCNENPSRIARMVTERLKMLGNRVPV